MSLNVITDGVQEVIQSYTSRVSVRTRAYPRPEEILETTHQVGLERRIRQERSAHSTNGEIVYFYETFRQATFATDSNTEENTLVRAARHGSTSTSLLPFDMRLDRRIDEMNGSSGVASGAAASANSSS